jgi:4-hydroxy-2-oxoheptanedioate aldolase
VRYPPRGDRGFATYPRAGRFGTRTAEEHRTAADAATFVLVMLESPAAIRRAGEIVAVDGVDGWLVGVADLGASRTADDPTVAELLVQVRSDPAVAGSIRADLANSVAAADAAFSDGAQLVVYNVAHLMMDLFATLPR